jgi:hypothetical protein
VTERVTVLLPVDDAEAAARSLAPGLGPLDGRVFGVVDNGLWASMRPVREALARWAGAEGGAVEVVPFDHLAPDFAEQQRALWPFAGRVAAAVTGLGN